MSDTNKRSWSRIRVGLSAVLRVGTEPRPCVIENLSLGGALVKTDADLAIGVAVGLKFTITGDEVIDLTAIVRWRTANEVGLQFDGLRARETWALGRFLRSRSRT